LAQSYGVTPYALFLGQTSELPDDTMICWADDAPAAEVIAVAPNGVLTVKTATKQLRFLQLQNLPTDLTNPLTQTTPAHGEPIH